MRTRRSFIQAASLLPLVAGCSAVPRTQGAANYTPSGLPLRRVQVSEDRVIRTVVGLRPYRISGFVVRADKFGDKLVVHNYGHGGGGITLSWGTSYLATKHAMKTEHRRCAVIGCGAVGLASARLLQDRGWDVTIYAKALHPNTTSNIAAAQWSPASVYDQSSVGPAFYDQLGEAMRFAYRQYQNLVGNHYGVRWLSNYELADRPQGTDDILDRYSDLYPELYNLAADQHPFPTDYARHYDTMLIEPPIYLPAVMNDFRIADGHIVIREFIDKADILSLDEPVIINCTGLGSGALFEDDELMPVKGQLIVLLPQPEVDYIIIYRGIYMMPRGDGIMLGGTFERNEWGMHPNVTESERIIREHQAFFNNMHDPWA